MLCLEGTLKILSSDVFCMAGVKEEVEQDSGTINLITSWRLESRIFQKRSELTLTVRERERKSFGDARNYKMKRNKKR
jgi:hypothetical protein